MIYGYARASTDAQDLSNLLAQLETAGCGTIFREKITVANAERPQLKTMVAALAPGDIVITPAVDVRRLWRTTLARIGPRCVRTRIGMADGLMPQGRVRV